MQNRPAARMIGRMNEELVKRYSLVEIALLALFVLGLGIAWLLVTVRQRIVFSDPIELPGSGLSVSMPANPGWEYETVWRYESDNSMALVAQQQLGRSRKVSVQWRYDLCSSGASAEAMLRQRVEQSGYQIGRMETIDQPVRILYAMVYPDESEMPFYLGIAPLDFGRHLELQVFTYQRADFINAETLFLALLSGIRYTPPPQLQAGKELVQTFWSSIQSGSLSLESKAGQAFLIKDAQNRPAGYAVTRYSAVGADSETQLQIRSQQYDHNRSRIESTFWFDGSEQRFNWKTTVQQVGMGRPREYTLIQEADGGVTLATNFEDDKHFTCDAMVLPELLLPDCGALLIEREQPRVVVDVISPTGFVVPTVLEKIDVQKALARSEQLAFVVRIDFLNNPNSFEELYFDENKRLIGRYEQQPRLKRLWELTTAEQLQQLFGDNFQPLTEPVALAENHRKLFY